jgi:aminoglycoside phosphotransferase (APT) family kinase protein
LLDVGAILAFAKDHYENAPVAEITLKPLRGGLESAGISRVIAHSQNHAQVGSFVVKPLNGPALREYRVHRTLQESTCGSVAPRLLGFRETTPEQGYAFLEWVEPSRRWPWKDPQCAALVLEQLARVHSCDAGPFGPALESWDYDRDLAESARTTIEIYRATFVAGVRVSPRPMLQTLGRVAQALPKIREQLVNFMGETVLHGDAHPGNAMIRKTAASEKALLLDWGRARLGSPLEDVCSWVQSLAFWEPEARRRHDSLVVRYLEFRGYQPKLSPGFRDAYWLAAGCNAFAGALRYHLAITADPSKSDRARWNSARAAADWLRVARRADACWRK